VCRLQAGELQLPAGPGPGSGSDKGVCTGLSPAAGSRLTLATTPGWGCRSHPSPGRWGNSAAAALGAPLPPGTQPSLLGSVLGGLGPSPAAPACPEPVASGPFPGPCRLPRHRAPAALPWLFLHRSLPVPPSSKFNFFALSLEHCILFNPSPVTLAPALFQLDSKNNLFIHTAHAIIS